MLGKVVSVADEGSGTAGVGHRVGTHLPLTDSVRGGAGTPPHPRSSPPSLASCQDLRGALGRNV